MSEWNDLFSPSILRRGLELYRYGSVGEIEENSYNSFSAKVEGENGYFVSFSIRAGKIESPSCTCAYSRNVTYCKHIAAVLYCLEAEYGENIFKEEDAGGRLRNAHTPIHTLKLTDKGESGGYCTLIFKDDGKPHYLSFGSSLEVYKPTSSTLHNAELLVAGEKVSEPKVRLITSGSRKTLSCEYRVFNDRGQMTFVTINLGHKGIEQLTCSPLSYSYYYYSSASKSLEKNCRTSNPDKNGVIELCVHKTAALIAFFNYLRNNRDIFDYSDTAAERLIGSYRKERRKNAEDEVPATALSETDIEPAMDGRYITLRITNTEGKYYKVRDTDKLYSAYFNREEYVLGKNCRIDFSSAILTPRASLVMELLRSQKIDGLLNHKDDYYYRREKDRIDYTDIIDDFFSIMKDTRILCGEKPLLGFRETEPTFSMKIDPLKDGKVTVGVSVSGKISGKYKSQKYIYWLEDGFLNRTPLSNLGSASAISDIAGEDGKFHFTVGLNLLENFYRRVLPDLRKCGKIEDNAAESIDSLVEEIPAALFYVSIDDFTKCITCSPRLKYDGKTVDVLPRGREMSITRGETKEKWKAFEEDIRDILYSVFDGPCTSRGEWTVLKDDDSEYEFLNSGLSELMEEGEVHVSDEIRKIVIRKMSPVRSSIDIDEKDDSVLNLSLDLGDLTIEELELVLLSYRNRKKYHRLKNGDFISFRGINLDSVTSLFLDSGIPLKEFVNGKMHLPLYRALYLDQILKDQNGVTYEGGQRFRRLIKEFKTINESDYEVPLPLDPVMRSYQKDGYRWMRVLYEHGFGGILADEMGLGKTVQALSLILSLKEEGKKAGTLIVTPASLVYNWKAECSRFTPSLSASTVTGTQKDREKTIREHDRWDILITSYDLLKRDIALYEDTVFDLEIIDEAQFIKNHATAAAKAVRAVKSTHRLALTGTPIENRLLELWSIFEYLMPGFLFREEAFRKSIANPIERNGDTAASERLKKLTGPFILRRLKSDVLKDLPEKIEETRVTPLEGEQKKLYLAEVAKTKGMLKDEGQLNENRIEILAELMRIREICCDPSLIFKDYKGGSAKREAVMDLITSALDGGHKILLFSQFTSMLEILETDLKEKEIAYFKITGNTPKARRLELVDSFNSGDTPLFLISLKAGGTGLNLTAADVVIHYDPWWNFAVQNQATDRAHRIGQTKKVTVYRMIAEGTIEEKIVKLQESKKNLADEIVSTDNLSLSTLTREDLMDLLNISSME